MLIENNPWAQVSLTDAALAGAGCLSGLD